MVRAEPIPTRLAAGAGLTFGQLRSKRWATPFHGVRIDRAVVVDLQTACRALSAAARVPVVISDLSAGAVYDWWMPRQARALLEISVGPGDLIKRPGVRCHRRVIDPTDLRQIGGLVVTSPVRTILDLAAQLPLIDLVVVMDSALHLKTCTREELVARAHDRGVRGIALYRRALDLADGLSESAMETLMRLVIVLSGLPAPRPQVKIYDEFGEFVARTDLHAHGARAAFEYDGGGHDEAVQHARDVKRWRDLRAAGYEVFPYTAAELFGWPQRILVDYQRVLGLPIDATAVRGWLDEWKLSRYNRDRAARRTPPARRPRVSRQLAVPRRSARDV
jgi:hypothetical protein